MYNSEAFSRSVLALSAVPPPVLEVEVASFLVTTITSSVFALVEDKAASCALYAAVKAVTALGFEMLAIAFEYASPACSAVAAEYKDCAKAAPALASADCATPKTLFSSSPRASSDSLRFENAKV